MSAAPKVAALRGGHVTLAAAADAFLSTPRGQPQHPPRLRLCDAHLLPRLPRLPDGSVRTRGPLYLAERRPVPARRPAAADICPHTGRARLGYDRAAHAGLAMPEEHGR